MEDQVNAPRASQTDPAEPPPQVKASQLALQPAPALGHTDRLTAAGMVGALAVFAGCA
jgi:hypothetical protein